MSIQGERIKELRKRYGITQEELAKACGYKGKSAIHQIEAGSNNMSYPRLVICAQILHTTTDYLSGLTSNDHRPASQDLSDKAYFYLSDKVNDYLIGEKVKKMTRLFADLSEEDQDRLLVYADFFLNATDKEKTCVDFTRELVKKDYSLARQNQLLIKELLREKENN